jgi:hypothetical protein
MDRSRTFRRAWCNATSGRVGVRLPADPSAPGMVGAPRNLPAASRATASSTLASRKILTAPHGSASCLPHRP